MDQQVAAYYKGRRFRWHIKLFIHILYMALHNAHVTYMDINKLTIKKCPLLVFLLEIIDELHPIIIRDGGVGAGGESAVGGHRHTPMQQGRAPRVKGQKLVESCRLRGVCKQCKNHKARSSFWCVQCNVYLHIASVESPHDCWAKWHNY
jgi:hypothetical protein